MLIRVEFFYFDVTLHQIYILGFLLACIIQTNVNVKYIGPGVSPLRDTNAVCVQSCFQV